MEWGRFFLKSNTQNVAQKLVPDPFLKNQSWAYLWIDILKFYTVCFCFMASWGLLKNIECKLQSTSFHLILSFKIKAGLELVILPHFFHNFWRKIYLFLCSINWPNFIAWLPLLCEILCNMCIENCLNFEINLTFLIQLFFLHDQNVVTKP